MMRIHWGVTYFSDKPILPSEKRPDAFWRDVLEIFEIQPVWRIIEMWESVYIGPAPNFAMTKFWGFQETACLADPMLGPPGLTGGSDGSLILAAFSWWVLPVVIVRWLCAAESWAEDPRTWDYSWSQERPRPALRSLWKGSLGMWWSTDMGDRKQDFTACGRMSFHGHLAQATRFQTAAAGLWDWVQANQKHRTKPYALAMLWPRTGATHQSRSFRSQGPKLQRGRASLIRSRASPSLTRARHGRDPSPSRTSPSASRASHGRRGPYQASPTKYGTWPTASMAVSAPGQFAMLPGTKDLFVCKRSQVLLFVLRGSGLP